MKRHLSPEEEDENAFQVELYEKLPREQAQMIINAAHRPNRALQDLSLAIDNLPMHFIRKNEIHKACTIFEDDLGSSEYSKFTGDSNLTIIKSRALLP